MCTIDFKVSVRCMTYNQSAYIEDALNGFTMQQTDFPFVCCIMDDASTDGEQKIINRYLEKHFDLSDKSVVKNEETDDYTMTFAQHKENKYCYFAVYYLKYNHYCNRELKTKKLQYYAELEKDVKYIALCEGDDYWTDKNKLQKQVSFLENNPDFTLCFHKVDTKAEEGMNEYHFFDWLETKEYTVEEMLKKWLVPTCSILYRGVLNSKIPHNSKFRYGDSVLISTCLSYGRMYCYGESMGCYRLNPGSWNGSRSEKEKCYLQISHLKGMREEFLFFNCKTIDDLLSYYYYRLMSIHINEGNYNDYKNIKRDYKVYLGKSIFSFYSFYIWNMFKSFITK